MSARIVHCPRGGTREPPAPRACVLDVHSCSFPYTDYYGRTFISWDQGEGPDQNLAPHLDPQDTGDRIVDGIALNDARANAKASK